MGVHGIRGFNLWHRGGGAPAQSLGVPSSLFQNGEIGDYWEASLDFLPSLGSEADADVTSWVGGRGQVLSGTAIRYRNAAGNQRYMEFITDRLTTTFSPALGGDYSFAFVGRTTNSAWNYFSSFNGGPAGSVGSWGSTQSYRWAGQSIGYSTFSSNTLPYSMIIPEYKAAGGSEFRTYIGTTGALVDNLSNVAALTTGAGSQLAVGADWGNTARFTGQCLGFIVINRAFTAQERLDLQRWHAYLLDNTLDYPTVVV